jgi:hypothetical protein
MAFAAAIPCIRCRQKGRITDSVDISDAVIDWKKVDTEKKISGLGTKTTAKISAKDSRAPPSEKVEMSMSTDTGNASTVHWTELGDEHRSRLNSDVNDLERSQGPKYTGPVPRINLNEVSLTPLDVPKYVHVSRRSSSEGKLLPHPISRQGSKESTRSGSHTLNTPRSARSNGSRIPSKRSWETLPGAVEDSRGRSSKESPSPRGLNSEQLYQKLVYQNNSRMGSKPAFLAHSKSNPL